MKVTAFIAILPLLISANSNAEQQSQTLAQKVFKKASPSIVVIRTRRSDGTPFKQGSGVVIEKDKVATNCHVLEGSSLIEVGIKGANTLAVLSAGDTTKDICILDVPTEATPKAVRRSAKTLSIGEEVFAIGSPKGLELSLSGGLVSQLHGADFPLIQTDAAISSGSSGGGLFDKHSSLVGITTFKVVGGESLNFASPSDWVVNLPAISLDKIDQSSREVREQMLNKQDVKSPAYFRMAQEWVDEDPLYPRAHILLAIAYSYQNNYSASILECRAAIKLDPNYADAWQVLGGALMQSGKKEESLNAIKESVRLNPQNYYNLSLLSHTYAIMHRYDEAAAAMEQALAIKKDDADYKFLNFLYGEIRFEKRQHTR